MTHGEGKDSVSCHACKRAISRFRETCPHCGIQQPVPRIGTGTGLLGLVLLVLLAGVYAVYG